MTALKGRAIKAFVEAPDPEIVAVLIYGPDGGLARERGDALARRIVSDFKDPFNYIELGDQDLKEEPARLVDEAAALSFAGGARVVRLRTSGEAAAKPAAALLDALDAGHLKPNALVLIEAGDLAPRSGLRKAFEGARRGAALPCYVDSPADVRALAETMAQAEDLRFEPDALDLVVAALGEDHGVSRAELDKLILYVGPKATRGGPGTITLDDVRASLVDGLGKAAEDAAAAAVDGAPKALSAALFKAEAAGASPIAILRMLYRQCARLEAARAAMDDGASAQTAMKKLRPPIFFAEQRAFERRLSQWSGARLAAALRMLTETEMEAKRTGAPQRELVERAAFRIAAAATR